MKVTQPPFGDDMFDREDELPSHAGLREAILFANATLQQPYGEADEGASNQQKRHRGAAALAAILGTLAVLFAIVQLSHLIPGSLPAWAEIVAVIISAAAVILGVKLAFQHHWLLERHKAERCRLLKFGFVTDSEFWCANAVGREKRRIQLQADVKTVSGLTPTDLENWLRVDLMAENPAIKASCVADDETLRAVVEYYRRKRLAVQMGYFADRVEKYQARHKLTWRFPSWLFFGSVIASFVHFIADLVKHGHAGTTSVVLILLAAGLPTLGAGIRTYRSTYEFARNAMRYEAKLLALRRLNENLDAELKRTTLDTRRIFHDLWCCEQVLEFEHREWLRLMIEAEWYG